MLTRGQREKTTGGVNFNKFDSLCEAQNNLNVWGFFPSSPLFSSNSKGQGIKSSHFFHTNVIYQCHDALTNCVNLKK